MLSVISKYFEWLWPNSDLEETIQRSRDLIEAENIKNVTTIIKGIGVLYDTDEDTCSISEEFYFKRNEFYGFFNKFERGDEVFFEAKRLSTDSDYKWTVTSVNFHKDSIEEKERRRLQVFVVRVDEYNGGSEITVQGGLNREERRIIRTDLLVGFKPKKGDYLRVTMNFNGIEIIEGDYEPQNRIPGVIISAEPTRVMKSTGIITQKQGYMCINENVYYEFDVIENGRKLHRDDQVSFIAIESNALNIFSWRAVYVEYIKSLPRVKPQKSNSEWDEEEVKEEETKIPVSNNFTREFGISISPNECVKFPDTRVGEESSVIISITVLPGKFCVLKNAVVNGDQNACGFELNMTRSSDEYLSNFQNGSPYNIKVTCTPQMIGYTKDTIKFEFDSVVCYRFLQVRAGPHDDDPFADDLTNSPSGSSNRQNIRVNKSQAIDKIRNDSRQPTIKGIKPFRQAFFVDRKMPYYPVPDELWTAMRNGDNNIMNRSYGFHHDVLSFQNYVQKLGLCVWLEEMAVVIQLQQYDINVIMRRSGQLLVIPLPNYPNIVAKLHSGDKVKIVYHGNKGRVTYEGYIKDIRGTDLFATFNEILHSQYQNEEVKVELTASRGNYRRSHFAVESAAEYLGESFLFPSEPDLIVKPMRIIFEEGSNEESKVQNAVLKNPLRLKNLPEPVVATIASRWNTRAQSLRPINSDLELENQSDITLKWIDSRLNEEQKNAVRRILRGQARPLPYIIYGPPGTGKTVTVVETVIQIFALYSNSRILVTAPSNSAADLIAEKLFASGCFVPGDFVRLLGYIRAEREYDTLPKHMKPYVRSINELDLVLKHRIVISTSSVTGQFTQIKMETGHFSHVFIDEAGYCTEPEALLPCLLAAYNNGGQVILAGDPNQLGPVISSSYALTCGLGLSFLERLMKLPLYSRDESKYPETKYNPLLLTKLVKNYRAHEMLLKIPSKLFYDNELEPCANNKIYELSSDQTFLDAKILVNPNVPIVFRGIREKSEREPGSTSWINKYEASVVLSYVKKLLARGLDKEDIGIITPYSGQVKQIRSMYKQGSEEDSDAYDGPKVGSVEEFQGGERKVIIFTTVRSGSEDSRTKTQFEFILNAKRFNVSITRAQSLLIVVGNPHVLAKDTNWFQFIKYCIEIGAYTGCELPEELREARELAMKSMGNGAI